MNGLEWWLTLFTGFAAGGTWAYIREVARSDARDAKKQQIIRDLQRQLRRYRDELGVPRDER